MMDCSQYPIHPRLKAAFHAAARKSSETVRRNGAQPALLMTWAYEDGPEMTARLAEAYTIAGNENDIRLHLDDESHPTRARGVEALLASGRTTQPMA